MNKIIFVANICRIWRVTLQNVITSILSFILNLFFSLKPLDIEFMKQLHDKVNIVPVIGKADTLTPAELESMKRRVGKCMVL